VDFLEFLGVTFSSRHILPIKSSRFTETLRAERRQNFRPEEFGHGQPVSAALTATSNTRLLCIRNHRKQVKMAFGNHQIRLARPLSAVRRGI
jgi:hypothetical protein